MPERASDPSRARQALSPAKTDDDVTAQENTLVRWDKDNPREPVCGPQFSQQASPVPPPRTQRTTPGAGPSGTAPGPVANEDQPVSSRTRSKARGKAPA